MKDESWTIKDKLNQYRGILKLHVRERNARMLTATKHKRKVSKNLKSHVTDVKEYRGIVNDVVCGDKRRMRTILQGHKDFQLAYANLIPDNVYEGIFQDSSLKRRQLDKLYYQKKKRMKEFFNLKLECSILVDKYEQDQKCSPNYVQQRLITAYQQSTAKQNAAKSIRTTYLAMLDILEKDSIYFDAVLDTLSDDKQSQCKVLLRATIMGQLAAENLDDTRQRYKFMANEVWINMKERERTLNIVRGQVEELWAYAQSLVRVESDKNFGMVAKKEAENEDSLDSQIKHLEDTFDRVKDSLAVRSYEEFFNRLEDQMKQKTRLLSQFNQNYKKRDVFLNEKNHALLILATLEHSTVTTTGQYKADKKMMLEQIEEQKKRESEYTKLRKSRGELMMNIRAAIQNMLAMLVPITATETMKVGKKTQKETIDKKLAQEKSKKGQVEKDEGKFDKELQETRVIPKFDTDALALLSLVSRKMNTLYGMSTFDLDSEKEGRARDLYQTYISDYRSRTKFAEGEHEPTGLYVEHEVIDLSILTRGDIKLRSRHMLEAYTKSI